MKRSMLSKVRAYLAHRRALGFQLKCEGVRLLDFARYVDARGHRGPLTTRLAMRWACLPQAADMRWAPSSFRPSAPTQSFQRAAKLANFRFM